MGTPLPMVVGDVLPFADLQAHLPPKNLAAHLQAHVEDLQQFLPKNQ